MALYGELRACEGRGGQDRALPAGTVGTGCRPGRKVNAQARAQPLKTAGSGGNFLPGIANKPLRPLPGKSNPIAWFAPFEPSER